MLNFKKWNQNFYQNKVKVFKINSQSTSKRLEEMKRFSPWKIIYKKKITLKTKLPNKLTHLSSSFLLNRAYLDKLSTRHKGLKYLQLKYNYCCSNNLLSKLEQGLIWSICQSPKLFQFIRESNCDSKWDRHSSNETLLSKLDRIR